MKLTDNEKILHQIDSCLAKAEEFRRMKGRPYCTLTYAQSIDGSIASASNLSLSLSGKESLRLTHHLRTWHDAILVGIRTVLADNPRLTARLVQGKNPQPVVLDTKLRMPFDCRLIKNEDRPPWIATALDSAISVQNELENRGVSVFRCETDNTGWISLRPFLDTLGKMGINSIMVEGGARTLTSFMRSRLVDQVIITIAPLIVGGLRAFSRLKGHEALLPKLKQVQYSIFGKDVVIWASPVWND